MNELIIEQEIFSGGIVNLKLTGNLDANTFDLIDIEIQELVENDYYRKIMLDMENISGISSAGAGTLLAISDQLREKNGALILYSLPQTITSTLGILGLISKDAFERFHLTVSDNREKAIELLTSGLY